LFSWATVLPSAIKFTVTGKATPFAFRFTHAYVQETSVNEMLSVPLLGGGGSVVLQLNEIVKNNANAIGSNL
jgi:hypothetical protein